MITKSRFIDYRTKPKGLKLHECQLGPSKFAHQATTRRPQGTYCLATESIRPRIALKFLRNLLKPTQSQSLIFWSAVLK